MNNFTTAQQQAIDTNSPAVLAVAGAGAGKTRCVVARIERLVKDGCNPASILCLTFTRKAARELKERLGKTIGNQARRIWAGTFHAISYRILMQWGGKIGYQTTEGRSITVTTPEEAENLFREIMQSYNYKGTIRDIDKARSELAHAGTEPEEPNISRIINEYKVKLMECNAIDFDGLLLEVRRLFENCLPALEYYQNKFDHIFVDEYQDTDRIQYNLHELLRPRNLFVVGDADQGIYSWRGAELSIIQGFQTDHPGAEVIKLEHCFRCGDEIVRRANNLIGHNRQRIDKTLIGATGTQGEFRGYFESCPEFIAEILADELTFEDPKQIAVIARKHSILEGIEKACNKIGLAVHRVGAASRAVEDSESFKAFLSLAKLAVNPRDNLAFLTANKLLFHIDIRQVWSEANRFGSSWFEALPFEEILSIRLPTGEEPAVQAYARLFGNAGTPAAIDFLGEYFPGLSISEFLEAYATKDMHTELENPREAITLITSHASKGLEWDHVLIAEFDEGTLPSNWAIREGNLEEERRLAYVAMTRARKSVRVFCSPDQEPSRFLEETINNE